MAQEKHDFYPVALDFDTIMDLVGNPGAESIEGAYVDAWHVHLYPGKSGKGHAFRKLGGTVEIPWEPPRLGSNAGMGSFWDERNNTLICFIKNDVGGDSIIWHRPDTSQTSTIRIPGGVRGRVTGCVFINAELLIWTDNVDYPKCIDLPRADSLDKMSKVDVFLPQSDVIVDFREVRARVTLDGTPTGGFIQLTPNITGEQVYYFTPMVSAVSANWNASALAADVMATGCSDYIELEASNAGMYSVEMEVRDTVNGTPGAWAPCFVEFSNRYNDQWEFPQMRLSRMAPVLPPVATPRFDPSLTSNAVRDHVFQFCHGYRLKNKEKSPIGPFSDIPVSVTSPCGNTSSGANCIDLDLSGDKWLNDAGTRGEVDFIDIYVREGNEASPVLVESVPKWKWIYTRRYTFRNDGNYAAADANFVLSPTTFVPPRAKALSEFVDVDDFTRIVFGNTREGYPTPCVDVRLKVAIENPTTVAETVSITGRVVIMGVFDPNPAIFGTQHYNFNQPVWVYSNDVGPVYGGFGPASGPLVELLTNDPQTWGQRIPLGGFLAYIAGTDKWDVTKQTAFPASVSGGTVGPTLWSVPQGHPALGRGVYDGTVRGYSLTPTNRSHRDAIRSMIEDDHVYGTFTIGGLERGKTYIVRFASNLVDILDDGTLYDLNNPSRAWQGTSTRFVQVGSNDALVDPSGGFYPSGTVIRSGRTECLVTIPLAGPPVIDIGNSIVMDTTNPNPVDGSFVIDGYLLDNLGADYSASQDVRLYGVPAEKQLVRLLNHGAGANYDPFANPSFNILYLAPFLWPALAPTIIYNTFVQQFFGLGSGAPGDYRAYSDHNGYWFYFNKNQPGHFPQAQWCGVTGDPGNPSGQVTATNNPNGTAFYQILNDFPASKWEGGLEGALAPVAGNLFNGPGWRQYIFANLATTLTHRTHIKARIEDLNTGAGVPNVVALLQNGRHVLSDQDGIINLVAFGDVVENLNRRLLDELILLNNSACAVEFTGGNTRAILINQFVTGGDYSESPDSNWYDILFLVPIMAMVASGPARCWSRGGVYPAGYYLKLWDGSRTPVKPLGRVRIPSQGEDLNKYDPFLFPVPGTYNNGTARIDWEINGSVDMPWAGRFEAIQIVIGDDGTRLFQLQWIAGETVYSTSYGDSLEFPSGGPIRTSYASGDATEIYIDITNPLTRYKSLHQASMLGYLFEQGDMLRILSDRFGNTLQTVVEVPVRGQVAPWIVIEAGAGIPQLFGGEQIEIYTPRKAETSTGNERYYDIPEGLIPINDPYGVAPSWSATSGTIRNGDTWRLPTLVPRNLDPDVTAWGTVQFTRESKSVSDFFASKAWGKGKVWFTDPDAATQHRAVLMRYSDAYLPNTNTNGLNFFGGFNVKITENRLGEIQCIMAMEESFVVPCTNGTFAIYKGIQQLKETAESLTQVSGGVLASIRPMAHHYGTVDPQAVMRTATTILAFDRRKGVIWQWASNQLQPISTQRRVKSYVMRKSQGMPPDGQAVAGWDQGNGEVLFSFPDITYTAIGDDGLPLSVKEAKETIQYYDERNAFVARMAWSPDFWGHTSLELYSFNKGTLWRHEALFDKNSLNVVGGIQMEARVDIPWAGDPTVVKDLKPIWAGTGPGWEVPYIANNMGQTSRIPADLFISEEGKVYKGTDIGNTNPAVPLVGDPMKGTWYVIRFIHPGPEPCSLVWVRIGDTPSADSDRNSSGQ